MSLQEMSSTLIPPIIIKIELMGSIRYGTSGLLATILISVLHPMFINCNLDTIVIDYFLCLNVDKLIVGQLFGCVALFFSKSGKVSSKVEASFFSICSFIHGKLTNPVKIPAIGHRLQLTTSVFT